MKQSNDMYEKKNVVIGVCGGIAAYKALDVVSRLKKKNINVDVIMTKSACQFVNPLSFQALSQNRVVYDMFSEPVSFEIQHISLAKKADVFAIVPATANVIGKIANGIADDMLTTTVMATKSKVLIAPAMNCNMYANSIVQDNINKLKSYGYHFVEPESGRLACGDVGKGKLADTEIITDAILSMLYSPKNLLKKNVLVTAGPTISPIDPVRFITNRSSGKMGYAIACEARDRGADVTLVSGPVNIKNPYNINVINVNTNAEMLEALLKYYDKSDIVIKAAAVADYKIKEYSSEKIKKSGSDLMLDFVRDTDILEYLGKKKTKQLLVGFAAESSNLLMNAKEKIKKKNLDYIVANDITPKDSGFASSDNRVTIISKSGEVKALEKMSKREVAKQLFDFIC